MWLVASELDSEVLVLHVDIFYDGKVDISPFSLSLLLSLPLHQN